MKPISTRFTKPCVAAAIMVAASTLSFWNGPAAFAATPVAATAMEAVVDRALASVARIVLSGTYVDKDGKAQRTLSVGTGFVIDNGGHLLTNCHVASDYEHDLVTRTVQVVFDGDQTRYAAEVVGCDRPSDLGLLYVPAAAGKRKPLTFAKSIKMGQEVVAVGFAQNIDGVPTITRGIISGVNRADVTGFFSDLVQTDAVLNRGNSGGPLMNMNGEVVGVNTYIYKSDAPGIYMSRSALTAALFAQNLIDNGEIARPDLGLDVVAVDRWNIDEMQLPRGGVYVKAVDQDSIAARAGIEAGDIIHAITVNNARYEIHDVGGLYNLLAQIKQGDIMRLHILEITARGKKAVQNGEPLTDSMIKWVYTDATIPSSANPAPAQVSGALPHPARRPAA